MTGRPVIGIAGADSGGSAGWWFTALAVWLAGGRPVRISPSRRRPVETLHGLILGGGADVEPTLYGQSKTILLPSKPRGSTVSRYILDLLVEPVVLLARRLGARMTGSKNDGARDSLEMELIRDGVKTNLPLLGICRGEQLLNVFFGGTLHQALKNFYTEVPEMITVFPRKRIEVVPGTLLARCLGHAPGPVNALHRQGVHQVGRGLVVSARDKNGIIQAIEHEALPFVLGVQWHPEYLPQVGEQRAIFRALVEQAKAHALHLPTKAATSTSSASAVTAAFLAACSIAPIADAPEFFGRPWLPI